MSTERIDDPAVPAEAADDVVPEPVTARGGRLEEEGDVAADYLEELLDIADIDGDIDIEVRNGRTYISIVSEEGDDAALQALVGRDGEVLEALQELARLSVLTATENRSRLVLDITGYRTERGEQLQSIAEDAVQRAKAAGEAVALAPMSAYERKIVHDAVADLGLASESEGEGADRHIVVSLPAS
ncbi:RNA-binding protein [Arthrobacter sp. zg-Y20]|uniref:Jag family protein n=1 Tax=unclassified Arthrobacter TaxID=235627 RepID=UPI001D133BBC|nr:MULTISPECIES: R3H domain-containing nucleic acid-binding protein [unclassified Arthrobacter]MCC3275613.1 RNA-binding protein [Arthrobacter sp. zg-Y20]MDK1315770.1 R3H domain-containing nucleic acid-binding protein [Arthrobacter sp. zg.Y20]WIB06175.1 R3H domain-containing nucleic acid-binding protein [Arthrobacter sp. zg-Y20]